MQDLYSLIVSKFILFGYTGIIVMMLLESSFFPFPSEIVMIPAGYLAAQGKLDLIFCVIAGILGSLLGAYLNYFLGLKFGKNFLLKYGKYFFLSEKRYIQIEKLFHQKGAVITLTGRLIPGVRQYISLPAGVTGMSLHKFSLFTAVGSGIWISLLSILGYYFGENNGVIHKILGEIKIAVMITIVLIVVFYIVNREVRSRIEV